MVKNYERCWRAYKDVLGDGWVDIWGGEVSKAQPGFEIANRLYA